MSKDLLLTIFGDGNRCFKKYFYFNFEHKLNLIQIIDFLTGFLKYKILNSGLQNIAYDMGML